MVRWVRNNDPYCGSKGFVLTIKVEILLISPPMSGSKVNQFELEGAQIHDNVLVLERKNIHDEIFVPKTPFSTRRQSEKEERERLTLIGHCTYQLRRDIS